jgi:hypothetical protein
MAKAVVTFFKCIQDSSEYGSNDEQMLSRVFFKLEIEGKAPINLEADIKQTVGSDDESGPIEVSRQPHRERGLWGIRWPRWLLGYTGPFNYRAFRDFAEKYYRSLVGAQDSHMKIDSEDDLEVVLNGTAAEAASDVHHGKNIRTQGNVHTREMKCEFEIDCSTHGWSGPRVSSVPEIVRSLENAEKALDKAIRQLRQR